MHREWSGGVLKQIIYLLCEAATYAILRHEPCLTVPMLKMAQRRLRAESGQR